MEEKKEEGRRRRKGDGIMEREEEEEKMNEEKGGGGGRREMESGRNRRRRMEEKEKEGRRNQRKGEEGEGEEHWLQRMSKLRICQGPNTSRGPTIPKMIPLPLYTIHNKIGFYIPVSTLCLPSVVEYFSGFRKVFLN